MRQPLIKVLGDQADRLGVLVPSWLAGYIAPVSVDGIPDLDAEEAEQNRQQREAAKGSQPYKQQSFGSQRCSRLVKEFGELGGRCVQKPRSTIMSLSLERHTRFLVFIHNCPQLET